MFNSDGQRQGATCGTIAKRWAINAKTPAGQAKLALLLTAYSLGKQVEVRGANSCNDWPDTESVDYILVVD
jgi:hypothetical protein